MTAKSNSRMILYARVSDGEKQVHSIPVQLDRMRAACVAFDYVPVYEIEERATASNMDRPWLQLALQMLKDGEADGVMVTKLDRLTSNGPDWCDLCRVFEKYILSSLGDHLDTSSASGRMAISIMVMVSQFEREKIGENTSAALQHRRKNKQIYCSKLYGYDQVVVGKDKNGAPIKELRPNPAEQKCIARLVELETMGYGPSMIARTVYKEG